jgi:hypothetical protein
MSKYETSRTRASILGLIPIAPNAHKFSLLGLSIDGLVVANLSERVHSTL